MWNHHTENENLQPSGLKNIGDSRAQGRRSSSTCFPFRVGYTYLSSCVLNAAGSYF